MQTIKKETARYLEAHGKGNNSVPSGGRWPFFFNGSRMAHINNAHSGLITNDSCQETSTGVLKSVVVKEGTSLLVANAMVVETDNHPNTVRNVRKGVLMPHKIGFRCIGTTTMQPLSDTLNVTDMAKRVLRDTHSTDPGKACAGILNLLACAETVGNETGIWESSNELIHYARIFELVDLGACGIIPSHKRKCNQAQTLKDGSKELVVSNCRQDIFRSRNTEVDPVLPWCSLVDDPKHNRWRQSALHSLFSVLTVDMDTDGNQSLPFVVRKNNEKCGAATAIIHTAEKQFKGVDRTVLYTDAIVPSFVPHITAYDDNAPHHTEFRRFTHDDLSSLLPNNIEAQLRSILRVVVMSTCPSGLGMCAGQHAFGESHRQQWAELKQTIVDHFAYSTKSIILTNWIASCVDQ